VCRHVRRKSYLSIPKKNQRSEKLTALLNFILLGVVMLIPSAFACENALSDVPPRGRAFVYMHYLGEQAKPFPLLVLTPVCSELTAELRQILGDSSVAVRHHRLPERQFLETWQFLAREYSWQNYSAASRGQDFYEVVLGDQPLRQTFLSRQEMLVLLQHILALIQSSNPNLSEEIHTLIRRLSN
jgi:hypothetical protein